MVGRGFANGWSNTTFYFGAIIENSISKSKNVWKWIVKFLQKKVVVNVKWIPTSSSVTNLKKKYKDQKCSFWK